MDKTNVMRILDQKKIPYQAHAYDGGETDGERVARLLGQDPARVFKTLVTRADTREYLVFVIPVSEKLDLKKAAKAAGLKSTEMILQRELFPLTGYVHGGCSPIGMKKRLRTFVHASASDYPAIMCSAGKRGMQIELPPNRLCELIGASYADLIRAQTES